MQGEPMSESRLVAVIGLSGLILVLVIICGIARMPDADRSAFMSPTEKTLERIANALEKIAEKRPPQKGVPHE